MKKFLLVIAALAGMNAAAQTFAVGDLNYTVTSGTTVEVSGLANTSATSINVPATVENDGTTYSVTAIGDQAFRWSSITSAIIPSSVEVIKHGAFNGADLVSITLNEGLKEIGDYSLSCKYLTAIDVPSTVTRIGDDAFFNAAALANVTLHEGLKIIGKSAFYKASINKMVIPASVDTIDRTAFLFCNKLEEVTLNEGLKYLGDGAFNGCTMLQGITLPSTLTHIGMECFLDNKQMHSIYIGAGVKELGESFMAKTGITDINLDPANPYFTLVDGVLYSASKLVLYAAPMRGLTEYTMLPGATAIYGGAFWGSEVANITLPESMLVIDDYAFCESALASINLPDGITYLGEQAFAATKLTDVVLPENAPYIQDGQFAGCTQLRNVTMPSSILQVYNHAFYNCSNLKITALGSNPPEIMDYYEDYDQPFYNASATIYVPKGAKSDYLSAYWGEYVLVKESETGTVKTVSTSPAYGDTIVNASGYIPMSVTITFDQPVELVQENPDAHIRTDYLFYSSDIRPDDKWVASLGEDQKTLTVYGADLDGYTCQFKANEEDWYYFSLPAGMVKNADGEESEHIFVLVHYAQGEAPVVPGDSNGDGQVDISDVNAVINMMLGKEAMNPACDMDGSGNIDISDVNMVINKMLGK